jgi:acetylornithine deacetylase/succinyl-diaminopimelate desuccinylase-like protein
LRAVLCQEAVMHLDRRTLLGAMAASAALSSARLSAAPRLNRIYDEIAKRRDESLARLQEWIRQPSIAAEGVGLEEGCALMMRLAREAGFQHAERIATDGAPACFATLDAGAARTLGLYFMYDVKQVNPAEWSSPPWDAALVDMPGLGRAVMGRAAVNQKGPQSALLAALHAIRGAGMQLPVNLVLIAEGEEEIGSPHLHQALAAPQVRSALSRCVGVVMPEAAQGRDGTVTISLGSKGVIELEIVSSGEKWGRGPSKDIHSSNRARVDSPAWRLVLGLATLVDENGEPAVDGLSDAAKPLSKAEEAMLDEAARRMNEASLKEALGVRHWARDATFRQSLEDICNRPTINIEGLVGGYTGPGGMTILPHRAAAKLDLRLVPDMKPRETIEKVRAHLRKRGFGDLEIVELGAAYDPSTTSLDSELIRAQRAVYERTGISPILWPRRGGSWPGSLFNAEPLALPTGHFGLGHGSRAHAPDEYYLIESSDSKVVGYAGAIRSFADYLFELGAARRA